MDEVFSHCHFVNREELHPVHSPPSCAKVMYFHVARSRWVQKQKERRRPKKVLLLTERRRREKTNSLAHNRFPFTQLNKVALFAQIVYIERCILIRFLWFSYRETPILILDFQCRWTVDDAACESKWNWHRGLHFCRSCSCSCDLLTGTRLSSFRSGLFLCSASKSHHSILSTLEYNYFIFSLFLFYIFYIYFDYSILIFLISIFNIQRGHS